MIDPRKVIRAVCQVFNMREAVLLGTSRPSTVVTARLAAAHVMRTVLKMSFPQIGHALRRDHSSIIYSCRIAGYRLPVDEQFRLQVEDVKSIVAAGAEVQAEVAGELDQPTCIGCLRRDEIIRDFQSQAEALRIAVRRT